MAVDPTKAALFIEGHQVRYKEGGMNGVIKAFDTKPVSASFQGTDVIVTLEDGRIRRITGMNYSIDEFVK